MWNIIWILLCERVHMRWRWNIGKGDMNSEKLLEFHIIISICANSCSGNKRKKTFSWDYNRDYFWLELQCCHGAGDMANAAIVQLTNHPVCACHKTCLYAHLGEDFYFKELHAICKCEISAMTINGCILYRQFNCCSSEMCACSLDSPIVVLCNMRWNIHLTRFRWKFPKISNCVA